MCRNNSETLAQNYTRLGLSSRLNASTWCAPASSSFAATFEANERAKKAVLQPGEARIVRDADGNVTVIHAATAEEAQFNDEFAGFEDTAAASEDEGEKTDVVKQLEALAAMEVKRIRTQSDGEKEWVQGLVAKYDHDWRKMARDRKMNPFQQTEGDIKRRVTKWEKENGSAKV